MNEIRSVPSNLKIIKRDDGTSTRSIQGYAIMFDTLSVDLGGFTEVIKPTALDGVDLSDIALVYAHENNSILARASAGNLKTQLDSTGLFFSAELPQTSLANDVLENIRVRNIKGMSFTFTIPDGGDTWSRQVDGTLLHTVNQIGIITELTVTAYPAYQTSVELKRSAENIIQKGTSNLAEENIKPDEATKESDNKDVVNSEPAKEPAKRDETPEVPDVNVADLVTQIAQLQSAISALQAEANDSEDEDTEASDESDEQARDDDTELERDEGDEDLERSAENTNTEEQKRSIENTKDNLENMAQVIKRDNLSEEEAIKRSYIDALKDVNKRDGVTVDVEGGILVPKQILDIQKVPNDPNSLAHYINRVAVANPTGTLPVMAKASARLVTKEELAKNPEVAKASITSVDYKVVTRIGQLPISAEMLQDYPEAQALVSQYLQDVKSATEEEVIGAVLSTKFGSNTAKSLDDLKSAYNKLVNYGSDRVIVASVSAFDAIDGLKDGEGRYYVQPNVTAPSGSSLFGAPVVVVADTTLGKDGEANIFVGSLKHAVLEAVRLDGLATSWAQNDYFEQVLSVATRFDVKQADTAAGAFYKFDATLAQAAAGTQG